jgi:hypothetical protein
VLVDAAPGVHVADSGAIPAYDPQITLPALAHPTLPTPILDLVKSDETVLVRDVDGSYQTRIYVALHFPSGSYLAPRLVQVQYRPSDAEGAWQQLYAAVSGLSADLSILPVEDGRTYDLRFRAVDEQSGATSAWAEVLAHTVEGKTAKPPDVELMLWEGDRLAWAYPTQPLDFAGFRLKRHLSDRRTWDDAQPLHEGLLTETSISDLRDAGTVTYLLKAVDTAGNESENPATVVVNLGDLLVENLLFTEDKKAAGFPGTITNGAVSGSGNLEAASAATLWSGDDGRSMWHVTTDLFWTQMYQELVYQTSIVPDADTVPCTVLLDLTVAAQSWGIEYRTSGTALFWTGTSGTTYWGTSTATFWTAVAEGWLPWPGRIEQATRQVYEFQLSAQSGVIQAIVSQYQIKIDVPDLIERMNDVVIAGAGTRLTLTHSYRAISNVNLTLQNDGGTAQTVKIEDKGTGGPPLTGGPLIKCYDPAGVAVAGTIDATVQGY